MRRPLVAACTLGLAALTALALVFKKRDQRAGHVRPSSRESLETGLSSVGYCGGPEIPAWISAAENQFYAVTEDRTVTILDDKLIHGTWVQSQYVRTTSFDVTATTSRGKDELFFVGTASNGECVIEKWGLQKIGQPGGVTTKVPVRTELYRGMDFCPIQQLGADPEQRFLLLLQDAGDQGNLYSMPIQANASPSLLYAHTSSFPVGEVDFIERYQHVNLGRVWVLSKEPVLSNGTLLDDTTLVLVDSENDGVFDQTIVGSGHELHQSGVLGVQTVLASFDESY